MHEHERENKCAADTDSVIETGFEPSDASIIEPAIDAIAGPGWTLPLPSASADELLALIAQGHDPNSLNALIERTGSARDAA